MEENKNNAENTDVITVVGQAVTDENGQEECASLSLDDFLENNGKAFDETENTVISSNDIFGKDGLAYADAEILPGQKADFSSSDTVTMSAEKAQAKIINDLAMEKLKMEMARRDKLSDEAKIRDFIIGSEYERATKTFLIEHGYQMNGQQKRSVRRKIEMAYKKGKYKLTEEQRQDLLYELSKASNALKEQSAHALDGQEPVTELSSLISQM